MATEARGKRDVNKFVVDFGDTNLPPEFGVRLNRSIQKAVLSSLADLDISEEARFKFPREWYGIIPYIPGDISFSPFGQ